MVYNPEANSNDTNPSFEDISMEDLESFPIEEQDDGAIELILAQDIQEDLEDSVDYDSLLDKNLADIEEHSIFTEKELEELTDEIFDNIVNDLTSMEGHFDTLRRGADLLGIDLKESGNRGSWSCGATHPLIIENAIKLQGLAINELDPPDKIVRTRIHGGEGVEDVEQRAFRKQEHMNYVITNVMDDTFYPESEKCWLGTAINGTGYKRNRWDPIFGKPVSEYANIDRVIVNNDVKTLQMAPMYSYLEPTSDLRIVQDMQAGVFRKIDLGDCDTNKLPSIGSTLVLEVSNKLQEVLGFEPTTERVLCYTYMYLDIKKYLEDKTDEDEPEDEMLEAIAEGETLEYEKGERYFDKRYLPFVIVTELMSGKILSIYGNWKGGDPLYKPLESITDYHLIRGFGFFSLGYLHILGNFAKMLTGIMRSLVDAGTFATLPAGFKLKGTKFGGQMEFAPGEFKDIESTAQDISKAIMALPFKEPSAVFTNLFTILSDAGQKFANGAEGVIQEAANYGAVGTTLALLESSSRMTNSILRGFHRRRKHEFGVIARIISENMGEEYPYYVDNEKRVAFRDDYLDEITVIPVSDPGMPTQAQRMSLAQAKLDIALKLPQYHDAREALKGVYLAMGEQNIDKIVPPPQQAQPLSPLEDIMAASNNTPIKAFPGQDHDAHIQFKQAFMSNPEYANSEFFKQAMPLIAANIREHMLLKLQEQIGAATTGAATDPVTQDAVQAMAMQQLTDMAQTVAQVAANAEDPTAMLAKVQAEKNAIDNERTQSRERIEYAKLAQNKEKMDLEKKKLAQDGIIADNKNIANLAANDAKLNNEHLKNALEILQRYAEDDFTYKS